MIVNGDDGETGSEDQSVLRENEDKKDFKRGRERPWSSTGDLAPTAPCCARSAPPEGAQVVGGSARVHFILVAVTRPLR